MDLKSYFSMLFQAEQYDMLSEKEKNQLNIFDILTVDEHSAALLQNILNFFIKEDVLYSSQMKYFLIKENDEIVGTITKKPIRRSVI